MPVQFHGQTAIQGAQINKMGKAKHLVFKCGSEGGMFTRRLRVVGRKLFIRARGSKYFYSLVTSRASKVWRWVQSAERY
jgi:hypothetical protein